MQKSENVKIIIFGTGEASSLICQKLMDDNLEVSYYADNNKNKQGGYIDEKPILDPVTLLSENKSSIFIIIASMYYEEISQQLELMGFEKDRHFIYYFEFIYGGNKYFCPFCKGNFNQFLPRGLQNAALEKYKVIAGGYRENAVCPRCQSFERERLIYLYLNEETNIFSNEVKLLHVAPEKNLAKVLKTYCNINYLSVDLHSEAAMMKMDITDIHFDDNTFDVIICNHVLEHIPADQKAMKEIYRVLKPNGFSILQVPISNQIETYEDPSISSFEERLEKFGQGDHVRIYGKDYVERLSKVGFVVSIYNYIDKHGQQLVEKYGLLKEEAIFVCYKST